MAQFHRDCFCAQGEADLHAHGFGSISTPVDAYAQKKVYRLFFSDMLHYGLYWIKLSAQMGSLAPALSSSSEQDLASESNFRYSCFGFLSFFLFMEIEDTCRFCPNR